MEESKSSGSFLGSTIEQLVTLEVACELVPFPTKTALRMALSRFQHELGPPIYRKRITGARGKSDIRMLRESDILKLRELTMFSFEETRYKHNKNRIRSKNATIRSIMNSFYASG